MKILTYISSLILSGFIYLLFAAYLTVSAGLNSVLPVICFYCALIIFGFLSWFHFFKPILGAILLTILIATMFLSWPIQLLIEHFIGEYQPPIIESVFPLAFSILTVILVWKARKRKDINKNLKFFLAIPPLLLVLYIGGYFTFRLFG
jgi:hypothetical protein